MGRRTKQRFLAAKWHNGLLFSVVLLTGILSAAMVWGLPPEPAGTPIVYVNLEHGIAISQTGRVFFLAADEMGTIRHIRDQRGRVVYPRAGGHYVGPAPTLWSYGSYDFFNIYGGGRREALARS